MTVLCSSADMTFSCPFSLLVFSSEQNFVLEQIRLAKQYFVRVSSNKIQRKKKTTIETIIATSRVISCDLFRLYFYRSALACDRF